MELLPIKNIDETNYYIKIIEEQKLSVRELRNKTNLLDEYDLGEFDVANEKCKK